MRGTCVFSLALDDDATRTAITSERRILRIHYAEMAATRFEAAHSIIWQTAGSVHCR